MRHRTALLLALSAAAGGCAATAPAVRTEGALGRVVVYRNGVAYFERVADVTGDELKVSVQADRVDDFLKSLTVVDADTGKPAPVAYPTSPASATDGVVAMTIKLGGTTPYHRLKLSYVTESPSWKSSYRVVLGERGQVELQGWAIVDNTSGEDWNAVRLGVGSSSALAFRFDLRSLRTVQRTELQSDALLAVAPPTGGAAWGAPAPTQQVVAELSDDAIAAREEVAEAEPRRPPAKKAGEATAGVAHAGVGAGGGGRGYGAGVATRSAGALGGVASDAPASRPAPAPSAAPVDALASQLRASGAPLVVEGYAAPGDADKQDASLARANRLRDKLVQQGVDPARIVAVGRGEVAGRSGGARVVKAPPPPPEAKPKDESAQAQGAPAEPIGTSHFESESVASVPRGTSAMVSIVQAKTAGEVVYLYDPESPRGNASFPFRAVRLTNPTDSVLESGPVSVFGEGRFIGEGLAEPIPARATAFVPFALDRQILVERKGNERDRIRRILAVQRGVFSTEMQHARRTELVLHNRSSEPARVWIRHTVPQGWELGEAPPARERIGASHLFEVDVAANGEAKVEIEEHTPVFRTADVRTPDGLELVRAFVSEADYDPAIRAKVAAIVEMEKRVADVEQRIATVRAQADEMRQRSTELHAQIVTLRMVRSGGALMRDLEKKMQDFGDRVSRATLDLVGLEEKRMIARVGLEDAVAELTLEPSAKDVATAAR